MSAAGHHHALPKGREFATLIMLGAVQFTHFVDFMIMMPLGEQLMRAFHISTAQFSALVATYAWAAALTGFAGGFVMDRFDRKRALLVLYVGFGVSTLACALAPTHHTLLVARAAAGAFGGLSSSMVTAMIGDIIPPSRRGRAMSLVMAAFPVASVLGVPLGLVLAGRWGWHAPFYMVAAGAAANLVLGSLVLPHVATAVHGHEPWKQMKEIVSHGVHRRAFAVTLALAMAGGVLIPFLAPSFIANVGMDEKIQLPLTYMAGGIATAISTPIIGWLSDRVDRLRLLTVMSTLAIGAVIGITRLGPSSVMVASAMMAVFMVTMSGRYAPAMTMVTNAVEARYRGGFMSVNSALQQGAVGLANLIAGWFVVREASGHLSGMPLLGWVSIGFFGLTVLLAAELRAAAPHVSAPEKKRAPAPTVSELPVA